MLSLCSRANASCMAVAEAAFVLPAMIGVRARCGRGCSVNFIFGVSLALCTRSTAQFQAAGAAAAAAQLCGRRSVTSRCARLGGTPGAGRLCCALGVILAHPPPP